MKSNRIILVLLAICLCIGLMTVTASAAETASGSCGENATWTLADGTLTISGTGKMADYGYYEPAPWMEYRDTITRIVIKSGITSICEYAFYQCDSLASVSLPDTLTHIENCAFAGCKNLTSVTLPSGLEYIGFSAFGGCDSISSITLPAATCTVASDALPRCPVTVDPDNPYYSNDSAGVLYDKNKTRLEAAPHSLSGSYTIPDTVTFINEHAFDGCDKLSSLTIPNTVNYIAACAFWDCKNLTSLTIPNSVTYIGDYAFDSSGLKNITIPNSVTFIGRGLFFGCASLTTATVLAPVESLKEDMFADCESLTTVILPYGLLDVGMCTFEGCPNLKNVYIPDTVTTIGESAFSYCSSLESITIPENVSSIGTHVFYECRSLKNVIFTGDAPTFVPDDEGSFIFTNTETTVWYPEGNTTWTGEVVQNYGGTLTWTPYDSSKTVIVSNPSTVKINAGNSAVFQVAATGNGLNYQWQRYKSSSKRWINVNGAGNATNTLTVNATMGGSGYRYRCKITDAEGNVTYSKTAYLYVLGIKTQPKVQKVKAGTTAKFTVAATGHNKTYQWQYKTAKGTWTNCTGTGNKTATLSFKATVGMSGRQYRCVIKDSAGNTVTTKAVYLYVLGIKTQPANKTAAKNTTVKFTVSAAGHNKTYQWQYKTDAGKWVNCTGAGNKTATLKITAKAIFNGRQFRCVIKDSAGNQVITKVVKLTVKK